MKVGRGSHQPLKSIGHDSFRECVRTHTISKGLPDLFRIGFQTFGFVSRHSTYPSKVHPCDFSHFPPLQFLNSMCFAYTPWHVLHCVVVVVWIYKYSKVYFNINVTKILTWIKRFKPNYSYKRLWTILFYEPKYRVQMPSL